MSKGPGRASTPSIRPTAAPGRPDLAAAVAYAARGWAVLPLRPREKAPLTPGGVKDATTDETIVRQWWARRPDANVGVATGSASGIAVLDIDPRNGGDESLRDLEARHGPLPDTVVCLTGGGGEHHYFTLPAGAPIRSRKIAPGLELKAEGGYVVAPPSIHPSGRPYEWEVGHGPDELPLAPLPAWLLEVGGDGSRAWEWDGEPIPEGARHNHLLSLAGKLRADGLSEEAIEAALLAENQRRCVPPLPEEEVHRIAHSMALYPPQPNRPSNGHGPEAAPVEALERVAREHATDLNHARLLAERLEGKAAWVPAWGWLVYRNGTWVRDGGDALVLQLAMEELSSHYLELAQETADLERRAGILKSALAAQGRARAENALHVARASLRADPSEFDTHRGLLNVRNGVVDLATGELLPHSPTYRFTRQAPVHYDPQADAPRWREFLRQVFLGNEAIIRFLQRLLGMAVVGGNPERVFAVLWGNGRNGKSQLISALRKVLGPYAATTPVATFTRLLNEDSERASPELASLAARRLVVAHEPAQRVRLSGAFIKTVTGGDAVKARLLFHEPFEFLPDFLPLLVTNHKPELPGTDIALWDRVVLVPFLWRVPAGQAVPGLGERLAEEEGAGILRWLVEGAMDYLANGLQPPPDVQAATAEFRADADDIYRFLLEETALDPGAVTPYKAIKQRYMEWCEREGVQPARDNALADALVALGCRRRPSKEGRVYHGVRLRDAPPPSQPDDDDGGPPLGEGSEGSEASSPYFRGATGPSENFSERAFTGFTGFTLDPPPDPPGTGEGLDALPPRAQGEGLGAGAPSDHSSPEGPPHPAHGCPHCQPAPWPWWNMGYRACRGADGPVLIRSITDPGRHLLQHALGGPAVAVAEALLRQVYPAWLVVEVKGYGRGWLSLRERPGQQVDYGEPQRAWKLSEFTWEGRQLPMQWGAESPDTGGGFPNAVSEQATPQEFPNRGAEFPNAGREFPDGVSERPGGVSEHRVSEHTRGVSEHRVSERPGVSEHRVSEQAVSEQPGGVSEQGRCLGCGRPLPRRPTGRPPRWCSDSCRMRAARKGERP